MERGYEQLVLLALFLLAALADWLVRWLKRKTRDTTTTDDVPSVDAEIAAEREWLEARMEEEARQDEEARLEEARLEEARLESEARLDRESRLEEQAQLKERPVARLPIVVAPVRAPERFPVRAPALEEVMARRPALPSVVAPARGIRSRENARLRRLLRNPATVRQAIVAMEVLGSCRGLQHEPSRTSASSAVD